MVAITLACLCLVAAITAENVEQSDELGDFLDEEDEKDCPGYEAVFLPEIKVPWGASQRAFLTAPLAVRIANSSIANAGLGVFATQFIPRYTWIGEYEGEVVFAEDHISHYAWNVYRGNEVVHFVDAWNIETSNWLRFINCANVASQVNVRMNACDGKVYYVTTRDLYPSQEFYVYYGDVYAETSLNLNLTDYYKS